MENILIVGGAKSLVLGNLGRNLKQAGVEASWHVAGANTLPYTGLPDSCEGVIVVRDMISHSMFYKITGEAKERGIPIVAIPRKWSHAEPLLRKAGFFKKSVKAEPVTVEPTVGFEFVKMEPLPRPLTTWNSFHTALYPHTQPAKTEPPTPKGPPPPVWLAQEVDHLADMTAFEHPSRVTTIQITMALEGLGIPSEMAHSAAEAAVGRFYGRLHTDLKFQNDVLIQWAKEKYLSFERDGLPIWPGLGKLAPESDMLFGMPLSNAQLAIARGKAFGKWAEKLGTRGEPEALLKKHRPDLNLNALMQIGMVRYIPTEHRKITSVQAVQDYLDSLEAKVDLAFVEQPKVEPAPPAPPANPKLDTAMDDLLTMTSLLEEQIKALGPILAPIQDQLARIEARLVSLEGRPATVQALSPRDILNSFKDFDILLGLAAKPGVSSTT